MSALENKKAALLGGLDSNDGLFVYPYSPNRHRVLNDDNKDQANKANKDKTQRAFHNSQRLYGNLFTRVTAVPLIVHRLKRTTKTAVYLYGMHKKKIHSSFKTKRAIAIATPFSFPTISH